LRGEAERIVRDLPRASRQRRCQGERHEHVVQDGTPRAPRLSGRRRGAG
jgi:hypothetical protein